MQKLLKLMLCHTWCFHSNPLPWLWNSPLCSLSALHLLHLLLTRKCSEDDFRLSNILIYSQSVSWWASSSLASQKALYIRDVGYIDTESIFKWWGALQRTTVRTQTKYNVVMWHSIIVLLTPTWKNVSLCSYCPHLVAFAALSPSPIPKLSQALSVTAASRGCSQSREETHSAVSTL